MGNKRKNTVAALAIVAMLAAPAALAQNGGMSMKSGQAQQMGGQMTHGGAGMTGKGHMGMRGGMHGMMGGMMMKRMRAMMMAGMLKRARPLSAEDVRRIIDGHLSMMGFSKLSARNVKIVNDQFATADVVAPKGEVILRLKVNRKMGRMMIVE